MSYATQDSATADATLQSQVKQAVTTEALAVAVEGDGAGHPLRYALARSVLTGGGPPLAAWMAAVVADGATLTGSTDADVLARVRGIWSSVAGV